MIEILVAGSLAFFGFIAGRLVKPKQKHRHIWKPVSSQHLNIFDPSTSSYSDRPIKRTTKVLKVCYCGENSVQTVDGNWEFDQLTSHQL